MVGVHSFPHVVTIVYYCMLSGRSLKPVFREATSSIGSIIGRWLVICVEASLPYLYIIGPWVDHLFLDLLIILKSPFV